MKNFVLPGLLATFGWATACEVPVFRFALERWPADPLAVEVMADGALNPEGADAMKWLENKVEAEAAANLDTRLLDPEGPVDGSATFRLLPAGTRPGAPNPHVMWEGPLNSTNARRLSGSPVRNVIAAQLLEGTSAVWVVVSRGDKEADAKAMEMVTRGINRAMQELRLPSGVIHCDQAAQRLAENPQATMDDVLRTKLPLRIAFTVLLVKADDPEESVFREIVANIAPPATAANEPLIAPIFGRGRILSPAPLSLIGEDRVFEGCAYLCGACACMVKQQNPGLDLPFRVNWDAQIEPHVATIDSSLDLHPAETVTFGGKPSVVTNPAAATQTSPVAKYAMGGVAAVALVASLVLAIKRRAA